MSNIFFSSDFHLQHDKEFIWKARGFKSIDEMNWTIISRMNERITADDELYILGDICLGSCEIDKIKNYIESVNCKIHIIRGNHDTLNRIEIYKRCNNVVEITEGQFFQYHKQSFYLSHYPCLTANYDDDKPLKSKIISVCGHAHTKDPFTDWNKGIIYHVEVDAHDCYPVSIDKILERIKARFNRVDN